MLILALIWGRWWRCAPWLLAARSQQASPSTALKAMLIVLVLSNCQLGHDLETRVTQVDDRRPGIVIWPKPRVMPLPTLAGPVKRDWYALMGAFASASATPTRMGDHESLEAGGARVEEE